MFGLSTSWKSMNCNDGLELLKQMQETEISGVELDYRITVDMFAQMKRPLRKSNLTVLSVHNFFPHPEILPPAKASGDALCLSSLDMDERKLAIKYACRSIQNTHDLEAKAIVFHLGNVDIDIERDKWHQLYDNGELHKITGKEFIEDKLKLRSKKRDKNFDAILFSLEKLNEIALKLNVMIGIENRYYANQIPDLEEIGFLLEKFDGGNMGYWHDTGHAQIWENFGLALHEKFLQRYSDKLIGIHLHDCKGRKDHIAPGSGDVDFDMVKKYLPDKVIKIIEVHHKVSLAELQEGVKYLIEKGIID